MDATVEELDRVLTRLALVDDARLEPVLEKLLPRLILTLSNRDPAVQRKVRRLVPRRTAASRRGPGVIPSPRSCPLDR